MHGYKEIRFDYNPGYFSQFEEPNIRIYINEKRIRYQEYRYGEYGEIIKGPFWVTKTDPKMFDDLTENICHVLYGEFPQVCDASGTLITAITDEGIKKEKYIQCSFYRNGLGHISEIIRPMLSGLTIPSFLYLPEDDKEEPKKIIKEVQSEPFIFESKLRKLLKAYGAKDKEIENFITDLYKEEQILKS